MNKQQNSPFLKNKTLKLFKHL